MRIVIFGAGALGSVVGGLLTRRHEVTLVGRGAHMRAIDESGLSISGMVEGVFLPRTTTVLDSRSDADAVIVTVKSKDLEAAFEAVRPLVDRGALLVIMQNGLGLLKKVAKERKDAVIGVTWLGATFVVPGKVVYAGEGETYFGSLSPGTEGPARITEAFASVGLDSHVSGDVTKDVWVKAIANASVNPPTAILRCKNGDLLREESLSLLWRDLCLEAAAVARACGIDIQPEEALDRVEDTLRRTAGNKSSMLQDIEKGRRTEIDEITGEIVRGAKDKGLEARMNLAMMLLIETIEARQARKWG
jgi:2-dehydropantoate 2-reductase